MSKKINDGLTRSQRWKKNNPERVRELQRKYNSNRKPPVDIEKHRKYHREYLRTWSKDNPEKLRKYREKRLEYQRRWSAENPRSMRAFGLARRHKMSIEEYDTMLAQQAFKCAVCDSDFVELYASKRTLAPHVDHDHATGKIRGLLCHNCNSGLGFVEKRGPSWAFNAMEYLKKHELVTKENYENAE